ncbi:hypothetical protein O181_008830 [Austropuccinia psidii MF-1]|uniref:Uncharacterized protein n=1 Tax=Austropuccinia psidii MF-1 TaxID=1389203 RepID=A0A9Q3BQ45_9BASI|nr:hypothetical protein [Austropuccinia psidii MF-1]
MKSIQEICAKLSKLSEETKKRLTKVSEEQYHFKRDREYLDQDINKLLNIFQNMKPQPQGYTLHNTYQVDIKPDVLLDDKPRYPSQYQVGDNMTYSDKEEQKQLPVASSFPKFSASGGYDHIELIHYIAGLFIVVPSILAYWITANLNTAFKVNASIWYTEIEEIHVRRSRPLWKSQIIQKYSNVTWIWQTAMSFENDKYSVDKDPYDISNTLQDVRKRTNIGKYSPYKRHSFKEKQPSRLDIKDNPKERMAEVTKKKNSFHTCGSTDHYASNFPKERKKVYAIEQVPEDSESYSMVDAIIEHSDDDQDPKEGFVLEYQEETQLEIQDV